MSILKNKFIILSAVALAFSAVFMNTASADDINKLLATADVAAGEQAAHPCIVCHTFKKGEPNKVGPNLWNVVGGPRAHLDGFNYSDALKDMHTQKWTYDALDQWLTNPRKFAPSTKMPFAGISDAQTRANLIAWLRTLSDNPIDLPAAK